jgi:hypothetical protein
MKNSRRIYWLLAIFFAAWYAVYLFADNGCSPSSVKHENWVFINKSGQMKSSKFAGFDPIRDGFVDGAVIVQNFTRKGIVQPDYSLLDRNFHPISNLLFSRLGVTQLGITPGYISNPESLRVRGLYVSRDGRLSKNRFSQCLAFSPEERLAVTSIGDSYYFLEDNLEKLRPLRFSRVGQYISNGLLPVLVNNRWGYCDSMGRVAIPPQFIEAREFHSGRACVKADLGWCSVDTKGKVCSPYFADMEDFEGAYCRVRMPDKSMEIINKDGHFTSSLRASSITKFSNAHRIYVCDGLYGFCDEAGKPECKAIYSIAGFFSDGVAFVVTAQNGKLRTQYIDDKFKTILGGPELGTDRLAFIRDNISRFEFHEGLAGRPVFDVFGKARWEFIDKKGGVPIKSQYACIKPFADGIAAVQLCD